MHGGFSMNSDVGCLNVARKNGGRGLISVAFAIESEKRNLAYYVPVHHSEDPLVSVVAESYDTFEKAGRNYKHFAMLQHLQSWKEKLLHGRCLRDISFQTVLSLSGFGYIQHFFKPGACPQPAEGRLWACAWFTEIVFVKVCVCTYLSTYLPIYLFTYLPMFVRTHPREQNRLITVKAAFT